MVDTMFDLDDCIGFITNRASKIIVDEFNRRLKSSGLTRVKWMALYYIGKEEGISQKELSHKMNVNESSIVRLLDRMEKEELSVRVRDTHDRRITKILLTPKGKALRKELMPLGEQFQDDATKGISQEQLDAFKYVLDKMLSNLTHD
jgi:DNA-binding MarR family transcriptional regulator